jgi:hypothetical protein
MIGLLREWWERHVVADVPPEIDGSESATRYLASEFRRNARPLEVATPDEDKLALEVADVEELVSYSKTITIEKTVERNSVRDGDTIVRQRTGSRGQQVYIIAATEDDLLNKENALISKAIRTEGLRLVPGDLLDECERTILATIRQKDAEDPDGAKRRIFDSFATIGVQVDQLKLYLGHDGSTLTPKELQELRAI